MTFSYSSFGSPGQLHQGEILFGIQEYQPDHPGKRLTVQDSNLDGQVFDRNVVVVTSECDLIGDYAVRIAIGNGDLTEDERAKLEARLLAHILLCEVFEESEIKEQLPKGSDLWRNVRTNQNIRFHMVPEATIAEIEEGANPAFFLDFKRMFSVPTRFLYTSLRCDEVERRGVMPSPWIDSLIDRLFHFHGRVCVPDPNDNRLVSAAEQR